MANPNKAYGLHAIKQRTSNGLDFAIAELFHVPVANADAIYIGDMVKLTGEGDPTGTYGAVALHNPGDTDPILGVVSGIEYESQHQGSRFMEAGKAYGVRVITDRDMEYLIRESAAIPGDSIVAADIGSNCDITAPIRDTILGNAGFYLDVTTTATTATLPLQILGRSTKQDNEVGEFSEIRVKINHTQVAGV